MITFLYPDFKKKTLTFSYDDNTYQDRRLIDIFRKYGLSATFNINTGSFGKLGHLDNHGGFYCEYNRIDENEVKALYEGFEIASHTVDHLDLAKATQDVFDFQVQKDCEKIGELCGIKAVGLAYPYGCYSDAAAEHLKELGIHYARTIRDTHNFSLPEDFLKWHPTCHDHDPQVNALADDFLNEKPENLSVFYIWGHSFEFDKTDSDRWADMETLCKKLSGKDDIWYASNREICDYVLAVRGIDSFSGINNTGMDLFFEKDGVKGVWESGKRII